VRRWRCCGGGWWRCRSSRTAASGGAAAVPNVRRCYCFLPVSSFSLPLPMFRSSFFFFPFPLFSRSVFFFPLFFFYVFLSSRFLSTFGSFSFSPLFFFVFSSLSSSSLLSVLGSIYRAKGVAFYCSHGEQPAGRPLGATAKVRPPSPVFWQVRGGWSAIVFGRWAPGEGGPEKIQKKASFPSSPLHVQGEEERGTVSFKTTPFCSFPFFFLFFIYI